MQLQTSKILEPIHTELERVETALGKHLQSEVPLIQQIGEYILQQGGKRIRPALLILTWQALKPTEALPEEGVDLCCVLEYIHTASLLHDDVIDHAELRRAKKTANSLWGNEAAVLVGDYLFTLAFLILSRTESQVSGLVPLVTRCSMDITQGEVYQLTRQFSSASEEEYFQIIKWKTASLMATAVLLGAKLACAPEKLLPEFYTVGEQIGLAYQLVDDVLDYDPTGTGTGKKLGIDLKERKITLPLSHLIHTATSQDKIAIQAILDKPEITDDDFFMIQKWMVERGALDYSLKRAKALLQAVELKLQGFKQLGNFQGLIDLLQFLLMRKK